MWKIFFWENLHHKVTKNLPIFNFFYIGCFDYRNCGQKRIINTKCTLIYVNYKGYIIIRHKKLSTDWLQNTLKPYKQFSFIMT